MDIMENYFLLGQGFFSVLFEAVEGNGGLGMNTGEDEIDSDSHGR